MCGCKDNLNEHPKIMFTLPCWYFYVLHSSLFFYSVNLQQSSYKHVFSIRMENSVDRDQMASPEARWSGSTEFSKKDKLGFKKTTDE